jgi:hypothetical protein
MTMENARTSYRGLFQEAYNILSGTRSRLWTLLMIRSRH